MTTRIFRLRPNVNLTRSKRRGLFESRAGYGCADLSLSFYLDPVGEEPQVWETVDRQACDAGCSRDCMPV